ncbi:hypothetical protein RHO08_00365 [Pasteurella multocida]|uniref:hypothetical protein n=1 Tax=Pasteurella multocida TaxID=747 RepID=UPI002877F132|nr:hypothetical protein [Pasteurella multocida]WND44118.1 hypothetical protein RHO08_00365 [Pasteurella multocida]HDR1865773.1 hypothetical protein [Pasteurella multocida]
MLEPILINILSSACYDSLKYSIVSMSDFIREKLSYNRIDITHKEASQIEKIIKEEFDNSNADLHKITEFISNNSNINDIFSSKKINKIYIKQENEQGDNNFSLTIN